LSGGTGTFSEMPLSNILGSFILAEVPHGEVAAVIVPVMGRFNRVVAVDVPHHVTQRGNGRRLILECDADRAVYLKLLHENMDLYGVALTRILPDERLRTRKAFRKKNALCERKER
jgi:hypothetical protein